MSTNEERPFRCGLEVRKITEDFSGLFSKSFVDKGKVILNLSKVAYKGWRFPFPFVFYSDTPTRTSIQIGDKHVEHHLGSYINHHCEPNCKVIPSKSTIVTKRDIRPDEEITIDYLQTESTLAEPFRCDCCNGKPIIGKKQSS